MVVLNARREDDVTLQDRTTYLIISRKGIAARRAILKAAYSASMVDVAMLVCNLDVPWIGQPIILMMDSPLIVAILIECRRLEGVVIRPEVISRPFEGMLRFYCSSYGLMLYEAELRCNIKEDGPSGVFLIVRFFGVESEFVWNHLLGGQIGAGRGVPQTLMPKKELLWE
jgi:hypothetical protein